MVMCSTMEKVGRGMGKGEAGVGLLIAEEILPSHPPKCQRALCPERPHPPTLLLPRMCWAARTSCGSESQSWKTRCRTCARSIETCLTSPPASLPGLQSECQDHTPTHRRAGRATHPKAPGPKPPDQQQCSTLSSPCFRVWIVPCRRGRFVCVDPLVSVVSSWCYFVFNKNLKVCPLYFSVCAEGCPKSQAGLQDPQGRLSGLT